MTPENAAKMQHTFDVVAAHMLTQNAKSMRKDHFSCAYRGENGLRCAVGFCIPAENYTPIIEGKGAEAAMFSDNKTVRIMDLVAPEYCNDGEFMGKLQSIHDSVVYSPENWPMQLKKFAAFYSLDNSIVDTFTTITLPQPEVLEAVTA